MSKDLVFQILSLNGRCLIRNSEEDDNSSN